VTYLFLFSGASIDNWIIAAAQKKHKPALLREKEKMSHRIRQKPIPEQNQARNGETLVLNQVKGATPNLVKAAAKR